MTSRKSIDAFVAEPALALLGMSRSGKGFGNYAYSTLRAKGYRVYPIHPTAEIIDGHRCYHRFADLPEHVDAALIVVPAEQAEQVVRDAAAAGIHHLWLQQGAESARVIDACTDAGIEPVWGECILMFARPTGFHKAHRWLWKLTGKLPT